MDNAAPAIRALEANLRDLDTDRPRWSAPRPAGSSAEHRAARVNTISSSSIRRIVWRRHSDAISRAPSEAVLATGAAVVAESDHRVPLDLDLPLEDERRYGDTLIRIHGPR